MNWKSTGDEASQFEYLIEVWVTLGPQTPAVMNTLKVPKVLVGDGRLGVCAAHSKLDLSFWKL